MISVAALQDKTEIRRRLESDRAWALYALADLDDGMFEHCSWWSAGSTGLALVFHALPIRPIFVTGTPEETRALLAALAAALPEGGYLNLREEMLPLAAPLWTYSERHRMRRTMLGASYTPSPRAGLAQPLGPADQPEIEDLYASGTGAGIAFGGSQLESGLFRGIREDSTGALIAVAGIHVASEAESVAGVGNVFVRADKRGQGLGQTVLSAVVDAVRARGIGTIGLNVEVSNLPAIAAYHRLGFETRFHYFEGPSLPIALVFCN
ncbi:MAG: GNAT family N-acetyltransferase [Acidobacteria bacterium]|nr:GNAT family N-acetyltransferase [Acidobacteriota bacterium]